MQEQGIFSLSNGWSDIAKTIVEKGRAFISAGYLDRLQEMIDQVEKEVIDITEILGMPKKAPKKIERNEKCPCGSGKKYKKCHGKKDKAKKKL